jgi:hypothetical protein
MKKMPQKRNSHTFVKGSPEVKAATSKARKRLVARIVPKRIATEAQRQHAITNLKPFKPGHPGGPGRRRIGDNGIGEKFLVQSNTKGLASACTLEGFEGMTWAEAITISLMERAATGDVVAAKELRESTQGRAKEYCEVTSKIAPQKPVLHVHFVNPEFKRLAEDEQRQQYQLPDPNATGG